MVIEHSVVATAARNFSAISSMWELSDHTFGIQQIRQDGILAQIPGSKLLIFVNEREGDNWWGTSMFRSAYQHWYHKSKYYATRN